MKRISKILFTSFLLLIACQKETNPLPSSRPVESKPASLRKGYVKAEGSELLDENGDKFLLRGTNLGSYYLHERWMALTDSPDMLYTVNALTKRFDRDAAFELLDIYQENYWTDEDFSAVEEIGLNCLRLPISYMDVFDLDFELMRSDDPTAESLRNMTLTLRKDHLKKMDKFISEAEKHGLYVILDLHGAYGSQNGNDHSIDSRQHDWLWRDDDVGEAFRELTVELWTVLAEHYKDQKNIAAYDLLNEPAGDAQDPGCLTSVTGKKQWDFFDELYKAIRPIDPNHVIIMESCWGAENLPMPSVYGWNNVMYEFHHYDSASEDAASIASHRYRVENIKNAHFGVPLYMGEFCPHCSYEGWAEILSLFNQNHIHWTNWNYRVKGFSEWGLFHIRTNNDGDPTLPISEIPSIAGGRDSFEEIERKWGVDQRKGYSKNEALCEVISSAAKENINFE